MDGRGHGVCVVVFKSRKEDHVSAEKKEYESECNKIKNNTYDKSRQKYRWRLISSIKTLLIRLQHHFVKLSSFYTEKISCLHCYNTTN